MNDFLAGELSALGAKVEKRKLSMQSRKEISYPPPVVIARYGNDKKKRMILVYGHYDVRPAGNEEGCASDPLDLTIDDKGRTYG